MAAVKTLVIQPRSGIGDMIWHLPYIRTLSREVANGPIYLLTKSKTQAQSWLYNEPSIAQIDYLDRRQLIKTGLKLRRQHYQQAWILHNSTSYAMVARIAGIPQRVSLGTKGLLSLLTSAPLTYQERLGNHLQQLQALFNHYNLIPELADQHITLDPVAIRFIQDRFSDNIHPWISLGIGATEDYRTWPADYFVELAHNICRYLQTQKSAQPSPCTFFICGSSAESTTVQFITHALQQRSVQAVAVDDLTLPQMFALLSLSSLFIGNDSGLLNASAGVSTPSVGLFGSSSPLTYSPYIYAATPTQLTYGSKEGMLALTPNTVIKYMIHKGLLNFTQPIESK